MESFFPSSPKTLFWHTIDRCLKLPLASRSPLGVNILSQFLAIFRTGFDIGTASKTQGMDPPLSTPNRDWLEALASFDKEAHL